MEKIINLEKITSIYKDWRPSDLLFIKSLEWKNQNLVINFYSKLKDSINKYPNNLEDFFEVSILFKNIFHLKLDFNGNELHQIIGFDILDISDNGWEELNFQIEEYENGSINFFCKEIEILLVI